MLPRGSQCYSPPPQPRQPPSRVHTRAAAGNRTAAAPCHRPSNARVRVALRAVVANHRTTRRPLWPRLTNGAAPAPLPLPRVVFLAQPCEPCGRTPVPEEARGLPQGCLRSPVKTSPGEDCRPARKGCVARLCVPLPASVCLCDAVPVPRARVPVPVPAPVARCPLSVVHAHVCLCDAVLLCVHLRVAARARQNHTAELHRKEWHSMVARPRKTPSVL